MFNISVNMFPVLSSAVSPFFLFLRIFVILFVCFHFGFLFCGNPASMEFYSIFYRTHMFRWTFSLSISWNCRPSMSIVYAHRVSHLWYRMPHHMSCAIAARIWIRSSASSCGTNETRVGKNRISISQAFNVRFIIEVTAKPFSSYKAFSVQNWEQNLNFTILRDHCDIQKPK